MLVPVEPRENHLKLSEAEIIRNEFGYNVGALYRIAVAHFKECEKSNEAHFPYDDRIQLMALSKQSRYGPFAEQESAGWFDFIGSDIQKRWKFLANVDKEDAMASFIFTLFKICHVFKDQITKQTHTPEQYCEATIGYYGTIDPYEQYEAQKKQIQSALNAHTFHQFSAYAQMQFPGQHELQANMIHQLQEQHYFEYMARMYEKQELDPGQKSGNEQHLSITQDVSDNVNSPVATPSMWHRDDIEEFKINIKNEGTEGMLTIGYGEILTIRVPTHEDGNSLHWEFATDNYDIGFGLLFERDADESESLSTSSEASDEEDLSTRKVPNTYQHEIIPIYRRDCHEVVYAGSHKYPGHGMYLLKFDNSYSLWRSKTLYYRVYYSN